MCGSAGWDTGQAAPATGMLISWWIPFQMSRWVEYCEFGCLVGGIFVLLYMFEWPYAVYGEG